MPVNAAADGHAALCPSYKLLHRTLIRTPELDAKALTPVGVCGTVGERDLADKPTGMYARRVPQTPTGGRAAPGPSYSLPVIRAP